MPRLSNDRHEAFARSYANHHSTARATQAAGFAYASGASVLARVEVRERIRELFEVSLTAADITAERVKLELGRVAFADVRRIFDDRGRLKPIHEIGDDEAAAIAGIEIEMRTERNGWDVEIDLATGEETRTPRFIDVRTAKIKRANKDAALGTLAKHFKLIGDEGDGVNALANALADRLKLARKRAPLEMVHEVPLSGE